MQHIRYFVNWITHIRPTASLQQRKFNDNKKIIPSSAEVVTAAQINIDFHYHRGYRGRMAYNLSHVESC